MEFNSTPGDLMELSPLFSDDGRVAEAASIAQKLREYFLYAVDSITFSPSFLSFTFLYIAILESEHTRV